MIISPDRKHKIIFQLKRILPWVAAVIILVYLFNRIDRDMFMISLKKADLYIYIPLIIISIIVWFLIESFNIQKLYQYFGHEVDFATMLQIRGSTFLLMIINYGLGPPGMAFYMKKLRGVSALRSMGMFFYYMVVESAGIALMAVAGFLLAGNSSGIQQWVLFLSTILFIFYNCEIIILKYLPPFGFMKKLMTSRFMQPVRESTASIYTRILVQRIGYFMTFIIFFYFAVRAFNIEIPFLALTALVPIIFFIGNLPITPFGVGTIQAAMLYFFKDYSSEANILAMSILYTVSLLLFRALIGLYYLKSITGRIAVAENAAEVNISQEKGSVI